jgi:hypothetical protein
LRPVYHALLPRTCSVVDMDLADWGFSGLKEFIQFCLDHARSLYT